MGPLFYVRPSSCYSFFKERHVICRRSGLLDKMYLSPLLIGTMDFISIVILRMCLGINTYM